MGNRPGNPDRDSNRPANPGRRKVLGWLGGATLLTAAVAGGKLLKPVLAEDPHPAEGRLDAKKAAIERAKTRRGEMEAALGRSEAIKDVQLAIDQELIYPDGESPVPDLAGARNPIVMDGDHGIFAMVNYDQGTGQPYVVLMEGRLRPVAADAANPNPSPGTVTATIGRVFAEGPATDPSFGLDRRSFFTAITEMPGRYDLVSPLAATPIPR